MLGTQGRKLETGPEASVMGQWGGGAGVSLPGLFSIVHSVGILYNPGHLPRGNITLGILGPLTSINNEPRK